MQGLLIQALALRQLGRLSTRKLLNPGPGPYWTEWCPRTLHTRQLCGSPSFLTLGPHKLPKRWNSAKSRLVLHHVRFKSSKKKGGAKVVQEEEEEDDEKDLEDSDYEDEPEDDPSVPKDYKDIEKYVQSFRYDVIMKAGLDIARNKVEDAFYGNKLWLNGQKLVKKSKLVKVGDTLDLVLSENKETDTVMLLRVIKKELGESKDGDRYKVVLRRWKNIELPKQNAFKQ